ncbi:MAG: hypothetical protein RLZZ241_1208 [Bacteroidota bacterium]|jgi:alkaline phosphatase D
MLRLIPLPLLSALLFCTACSNQQDLYFTIAFGSCNRTELPNVLWDDVLQTNPDVWVWGGDIVYADTDSIPRLVQAYRDQTKVAEYRKLLAAVPVMGTWDDHDYGLNDGGAEFAVKAQSQQAFLDFLQVPATDVRRKQEGVYYVQDFNHKGGHVKVIVLDTRYHRSPLTPDTSGIKRYVPNTALEATMLGKAQWAWLENTLRNSEADFNVIVSSIQVLSDQHGFETWGNMPRERTKLLSLIHQSGARGVVLLSGDRHISEFSTYREGDWTYPVIDFTSSGLTHVYSEFKGEENPYRVGEVVSKLAFGLVRFNFNSHTASFNIVGDGGVVLGTLEQQY